MPVWDLLVLVLASLLLAFTLRAAESANEEARLEELQEARSGTLDGLYENTDEEWLHQVWSQPRTYWPREALKPVTPLPPGPATDQPTAVIYLNLRDAQERRRHTEARLDEAFPEVPWYRLEAVRYPGEKALGILASHTLALKYAAQRQGSTWICEDDFEWCVDPAGVAARTEDFLRATRETGYDVFLASPYVYTWGPVEELGGEASPYRRIFKATTATLYLVTPRYAAVLADLYDTVLHHLELRTLTAHDHCDQAWHQVQPRDRWLAPLQPWCQQRSGTTSTGEVADNRFTVSPKGTEIRWHKDGRTRPVLVTRTTSLRQSFPEAV